MCETDRRVGGVHALTAGAACVVHVDAYVGRVDVDLDVVGQQRKHLDARKGRLAPLLVVGGRDAHQAVHAGLRREHAERVFAAHRERRPVEADELTHRGVGDLDLPAPLLAIAQVHMEQHLGPVLGLVAALSRGDGHNGIAVDRTCP